MTTSLEKAFTAIAEGRPRGGMAIKLPFDPSAAWGERERYDVTGTINGHRVRGKLTTRAGGHVLELGPAWCRDATVGAGVQVLVLLAPEGPQLAAMAEDIAAALEAEPAARRFFESLATFYRKNFIRWIEGAKRPQTRASRIAEAVAILKSVGGNARGRSILQRARSPDSQVRHASHPFVAGMVWVLLGER